jgi:hypothetical protein
MWPAVRGWSVSPQSNELWPETSSQNIMGFLKIVLNTKVWSFFSLIKQRQNKTKPQPLLDLLHFFSGGFHISHSTFFSNVYFAWFPIRFSSFLTLTCYSKSFKSMILKLIRPFRPLMETQHAFYTSDMVFLDNISTLMWEIYSDSITRISMIITTQA